MKSPLAFDLPDEEATARLARGLAERVTGGELVVLDGELGAGKTFFAGAFCRALGLDADEPVPSPTFTLVHSYDTQPPIEHSDLYRLASEEEVFELGLRERREEGAVLLVEWGVPYVGVLGGDAIVVRFSLRPRRVALEATGPEADRLLTSFGEELAKAPS